MRIKIIPHYVWTVNEEKMMNRLMRLHVDGIITDRPDVLIIGLNQL